MKKSKVVHFMENGKFNDNNYFSNKLGDILTSPSLFITKNRELEYLNIPCVFDIETSSFYNNGVKQSILYAFTFGINGRSIKGRTLKEFVSITKQLIKHYTLNINRRIIIYVHNLSFEFQFIRKYFKWFKVFSLDERKPVYAITIDGIEFRCSYILTNYSLAKLGDNLIKYKVPKLVGDLDYNLLRTPLTPLTEKEWNYILNDGRVVMCKIQEEIETCGGIHKIPLTATSYVRKYIKKCCFKDDNDSKFKYYKFMKNLTLDEKTYKLAKRCFMGGFTHANINYVGKIIKNVSSYDFTSSYPAVMLSEQFPMSKPKKYHISSMKDFYNMLNHFCCMFTIKFNDICSKVKFEHYISLSKCMNIENPIVNNGRIIEADSLIISITEQDFFIIKEMYMWESFEIYDFYYSYKSYLPKPIIEGILDLYVKKTALKGVENQEKEYLRSKEMINSCYGMCVTDICKEEHIYENGWITLDVDYEKCLKEYNTNRNRTLYYLWGIYVTAYARRNLFSGILEFKDDYIYSDTDSIKCINRHRHLAYIESYNKTITYKLEQVLKHYNLNLGLIKPKTIKGIEKPLGIWDYEGEYTYFKTLGAKRYMYIENNSLHITISGVGKKQGAKYLSELYNNNWNKILKAFKDGLYFPKEKTGKLTHTYLDNTMKGMITDYKGQVYEYKELSGIHLEPSEYKLGMDEDFLSLISGLVIGK